MAPVTRLAPLALVVVLAILAVAGGGEPAAEPAGDVHAAARALYRAEACWQCHAHAREEGFPAPEGTRRAGPVLGAPGPHRSPEWLRALLFDPRALVPEATMPSYANRFEEPAHAGEVEALVRRHDARDGSADQDGIVTRREYEASGGTGWDETIARLDTGDGVLSLADAAPAPSADLAALIVWLSEDHRPAAASPPGAEPATPPAPLPVEARPAAIARGAQLFARHCAGCHGARADGAGPAARFLTVAPRNLVRGAYKYRSSPTSQPPLDEDLARTIRRGAGGSMPP
jgi:cytochrome c oxidase cbb3-type subunit 2